MSTSPHSHLHFFCGKMAAGKSTLARALAEKNCAILLTEDEWLSTLYPDEITDIPSYIKYSLRLKHCLNDHIKALLKQGTTLVLDFPANTIKQRDWFRSLYAQTNTAHTLHYIDVSDTICKQQLQKRNLCKPEGAAFTTEKEFDEISKYFERPDDKEGFNIARY